MNVTVNREGNDATLKITVPAADVAKGYKSAVQRIASQVKIPGFRPGKAPRNVIEMHYGKEAVKEEAFNVVVNRAYQTALTQEKLMPVSDPSVNEEKAFLTRQVRELFGIEYYYGVDRDEAAELMDREEYRAELTKVYDELESTINSIFMYKEENAYAVARRIEDLNILMQQMRKLERQIEREV